MEARCPHKAARLQSSQPFPARPRPGAARLPPTSGVPPSHFPWKLLVAGGSEASAASRICPQPLALGLVLSMATRVPGPCARFFSWTEMSHHSSQRFWWALGSSPRPAHDLSREGPRLCIPPPRAHASGTTRTVRAWSAEACGIGGWGWGPPNSVCPGLGHILRGVLGVSWAGSGPPSCPAGDSCGLRAGSPRSARPVAALARGRGARRGGTGTGREVLGDPQWNPM